jgi:hypothetical protein
MVSIPRAELDALRAENRRLRREAGDAEALRRIRSDSGEGRTFTHEELAEAWGIRALPRILWSLTVCDARVVFAGLTRRIAWVVTIGDVLARRRDLATRLR